MGNIEADANVPKPDVQVVTPTMQVVAQPPRADTGINLGLDSLGFGGGASGGVDVNANAPQVGVDVNAPKVGVEAKAPEVKVAEKVGEFFEGVGASIDGLFSGGASAKAPKADLNVETPSMQVAAPQVQAGLDVNAPRADLQVNAPSLEVSGKVKKPKVKPPKVV